jgi:hypothetical protein
VEHEYLKRMFFTMRQLISDPKIVLSQLFTTFYVRSKAKIHFTSLELFWVHKEGRERRVFALDLSIDTTSHLSPWVKKL